MFKPHLACDADWSRVVFPCIHMPKIDGVRGLHFTGRFTARTLKPFANVHLVHFDNLLFTGLDGELAISNPTSPSLCRDTTSAVTTINGPKAQEFTWHLFDFVTPLTANKTYRHRHDELRARVLNISTETSLDIKVVEYGIAHSREQLEEAHASYIAQGFEGTIVRGMLNKHKNGRCTASEGAYLRIKDFVEEEAIVLAINEGVVNNNVATTNLLGYTVRSSHKDNKVPNGMVGSLACKDIKTGAEITVSAGALTHAERLDLFVNQHKIIGKTIKYRCMPFGKKDLPRFPTFVCIRPSVDIV